MLACLPVIVGRSVQALASDVSKYQKFNALIGISVFFYKLAFLQFLVSMFGMFSWIMIGRFVDKRVKCNYFKALLNQDVGWYDGVNAEILTSNYVKDTLAFKGGVGKTNFNFINSLSQVLFGITIALYKGFVLTAIALA